MEEEEETKDDENVPTEVEGGASTSRVRRSKFDKLKQEFKEHKATTNSNFEVVINMLQENFTILESLREDIQSLRHRPPPPSPSVAASPPNPPSNRDDSTGGVDVNEEPIDEAVIEPLDLNEEPIMEEEQSEAEHVEKTREEAEEVVEEEVTKEQREEVEVPVEEQRTENV